MDDSKDSFGIGIDDDDVKGTQTGQSMDYDVPSGETSNTQDEGESEEDQYKIKISDQSSPIVMFFGPRSSGKSMTLVRLSRFLRNNGYTITADQTFKSGQIYRDRCKAFMKNLDTNKALPGTPYADFLLLRVSKHGKVVCQLLEAPGEHYFDPHDVNVSNFPPYMAKIMRTVKNRKIWAFIAEANWNVRHDVKDAYVNRIRNCMNILVDRTDSFLILYNKVDQMQHLFEDGRLLIDAAQTAMSQEYTGLCDIFKNTNPIKRYFKRYNFKFVPFCTGMYFEQGPGKPLWYESSEDSYPRMLWDALLKSFKG